MFLGTADVYNKVVKVKQVTNKIKEMDSKIVLLQETHLFEKDSLGIRRRLEGGVYRASFSSQARGVMTLIHKTVPFQVKNVLQDTFGRYFNIQGSLLSENLNLVNVYCPNTDDPSYYVNLFLTLSTFAGQQGVKLYFESKYGQIHSSRSISH